jgi:cytochrome c
VALYVTLAQLVFGPLVLFTLPGGGLTIEVILVILAGVTVALAVLHQLGREVRADDARIGRRYFLIWGLLAVVILAMGTGRHLYREFSLNEHKKLIEDASVNFHSIEVATRMRLEAGLGAGEAVGVLTGEKVFVNCAACHAVDKVLAAPSLVEVYSLYKENPEGIITWAKDPGRKRQEFAPMPSFAHLGDEKLSLVAEYMLELGSGEANIKDTASSGGQSSN